VRLAGLDHHDITGVGVDPAHALAEAHLAREHLEALLLRRVHVHPGHVPVGSQLDVDLEQLAIRVGRRLAEGDALAADGVLDRLSWVCHRSLLVGG
jgi:hypothetical protein